MKKLLTVAFLVAGLMAFSAGQSNAQVGPFCISLDNYCDIFELSLDTSINGIYGVWDYTCTGSPLQPGQGTWNQPVFTFATYIGEQGYSWIFHFNLSTRLFDMYQYDGTGTPVYWILDSPWSFTVGPCVFCASNNKNLPSVMARMLE